jgi:ribosomal protein L7Ae-like RNA K-turn-binding protein
MPGRGAWVKLDADAIRGLEKAKGKLHAALGAHLELNVFLAAAREGALRGVRDGLSLGARTGAIVLGADALRAALSEGRIAWCVVSSDASDRTVADLRAAAEGHEVRWLTAPWTTAELGGVVGRGLVAVAGLPASRVHRGLFRLLRLLAAVG